jgi:amidase
VHVEISQSGNALAGLECRRTDKEAALTRILRDQFIYAFDPDVPAIATIRSGDTITVETHDTSTGRIHRAEDVPGFIAVRDPQKVNPAAGPIWIEGAEPGDALAVEILGIRPGPYGFVRLLRNAGVLQDGMVPDGVMMVETDGDHLVFGGKVRLAARPMVGVVGTAPASGRAYTAHPAAVGSNADFNAITVGTTVHLPVHVPGALLGIGDVHAAMGDGEVSGTGVEISAEVDARVTLRKGAAPDRIWLETADDWVMTGQGETLEGAVQQGVEQMTHFLQQLLDINRTEAFLLVSARGDVRFGQCARIAGCDATVYVRFPKAVERI